VVVLLRKHENFTSRGGEAQGETGKIREGILKLDGTEGRGTCLRGRIIGGRS